MEKGLINLLSNQEPAFKRTHVVQVCGSVALSRGLIVFAVHNGSECLGYSDVSATLPWLNVSRGCLGGKGGQNVTDVYRFTSKETLPRSFKEWFILPSIKLSFRYFIHLLGQSCIHSFTHSAIYPYLRLFYHFESINHSVSQSLMYLYLSIY